MLKDHMGLHTTFQRCLLYIKCPKRTFRTCPPLVENVRLFGWKQSDLVPVPLAHWSMMSTMITHQNDHVLLIMISIVNLGGSHHWLLLLLIVNDNGSHHWYLLLVTLSRYYCWSYQMHQQLTLLLRTSNCWSAGTHMLWRDEPWSSFFTLFPAT